VKTIVIIGNILDRLTYDYAQSPNISNLFSINDSVLRQLHLFKQLKKNGYNAYLVFREKDFKEDIDDKNIVFFPHITDCFYKIPDIDLVIANMNDYEIHQDLLLLDKPFFIDVGSDLNVEYKSESNLIKKHIKEHMNHLLPSILNGARCILYSHPNQRIIYLWELSKKFMNNALASKTKLVYCGYGMSGRDDFNQKDNVLNCIFADQYNPESNIDILAKALKILNVKFDYHKNEIYRDTIGITLYNFNNFNSLVYFPFKTLEFASYGHKVVLDDNILKLFSHYRSLIYFCNSSNLNKLTKMIGIAMDTPIDNNILQQFRQRYSWENQLSNAIDSINYLLNKPKNKVVIKKIIKQENKNGTATPGAKPRDINGNPA